MAKSGAFSNDLNTSKVTDYQAVREQLQQIISSKTFKIAPKQCAFLQHIVSEAIQGRENSINATSIAQTVYGRGAEFEPHSDPIIRVEAGRLRSRLIEYYSTFGQNDPVSISIPKGSYVPHFELREPHDQLLQPAKNTQPNDEITQKYYLTKPTFIVGLVSLVAGILMTLLFIRTFDAEAFITTQFTNSSEVYAMFRQTLDVARPPTIKTRVLAGIQLARENQNLDPDFGGGYAAESFQLWLFVIFGHSTTPKKDAARALKLAKMAIEVDPEFGWGYVSLSRALQLNGNIKASINMAKQAVDIDSNNPEFLGNLGLALAISGNSSDAIAPLIKAIQLSGGKVRIPYLNYLGMAYFHNRDFDSAIKIIEKNRTRGGPTGVHMYAYLAASFAMMGIEGKARAYSQLIRSDKFKFTLRPFIENLITEEQEQIFLLAAINQAGLLENEF